MKPAILLCLALFGLTVAAHADDDYSRLKTYNDHISALAAKGDFDAQEELKWLSASDANLRELLTDYISLGGEYYDALSAVEADVKNGAVGVAENRRMLKWVQVNKSHLVPLFQFFEPLRKTSSLKIPSSLKIRDEAEWPVNCPEVAE